MPSWLVAEMQVESGRRSALRLPRVPRSDTPPGTPITDGSRNTTLCSLAGTMRRRGMGQAAIEAALLAENAERCDPPLDEEEVKKVAASVSGYAPDPATLQPAGPTQGKSSANGKAGAPSGGPPRKPPPPRARFPTPYQPFPAEALPEPLGCYVRECSAALGCDPSFVALPVLSVAASAIGNTRVIRLKRGWQEPAVIWSIVVGDSGTLKTPAYHQATGYLIRKQKEFRDAYLKAKAEYEQKLAEWKANKKKFEKKEVPDDPGDPPEVPVFRRVICSDITIEKLAEVLEENPRGVLLARDEMAGWLGSFTRYKGKGGGTDLPHWLEFFRAGPAQVDRKTGERTHYFIPRAFVCVTGGIQPGVLARAFTPEFLDSGLAARPLMAMPPKVVKCWNEAEVSVEAEQAYHEVIDRLQELEFAKDSRGAPMPRVLKLSPEAKRLWVEFYNDWAQEQAAAAGAVAAALSKLEAYAARLALLHHVVSLRARGLDDEAPVGPESVLAGIRLCRWFAAEARRIYSTLSETEEERNARTLYEYCRRRGGRVSVRDLQNSNSRKYPTREHAEEALEGLVQAGMARWLERQPSRECPNPPREVEIVIPTADSSDSWEPGADDLSDDASDSCQIRPTVA
jgi:hypothetical protein